MTNGEAGMIIGKGGLSIKAMRRKSGAKILLSQSRDYFPGSRFRTVLLMGDIESLVSAALLTIEKQEEVRVL